ncbi:hypothetical protein JCGZ_23882 [Jatropha curcas]|uniref:Tyrosine-protein kinase catalytic domain-containing protein n=1 Tax=Jatropha curcas TaxID=180498 RepID=A0A067LEK4_JATCU|nr:hypothetical protein JCGZ_23882 [Jatropha curcas]
MARDIGAYAKMDLQEILIFHKVAKTLMSAKNPLGMRGDGKVGCQGFRITTIAAIVGGVASIMIIALLIIILYKRRRNERNFLKNGGLLLEHQRVRIFREAELVKATKNYDPSLLLGEGGFGYVYKGVLADNTQVAVKKPKDKDKTQINQEFQQELGIVSQVNHRNVVKVLGLCLETEVPLSLATTNAESNYLKYKDPKQPFNTRIRDLMGRMTLAEKIGQMVQLDRAIATPDILKNYSIGSLLSGGGSVPKPQATPEDWIGMINWFQNGSLSSRLGIPLIYGIDAVHGHNNVYKATVFPQYRPWSNKVCRDPRWARCYESYGEDPMLVRDMTEIISGLQGDAPKNGVPYISGKDKVAACAKHFVGDGGTTRGINENNTVIDYRGLMRIHMPAYLLSVIKGVSTIMVSYSSWNGQKMHANHDLVTNLLKNTFKFRGFVISDWQGIDKITSPSHANYTYSVLEGISAGIDLFMVPYNYTEFIGILTDLVNKNVIPMSRIDDAVRRILRVKFTLAAVDPSTEITYSENPEAAFVKANNFSYAIVVIGELPYAETNGDNLNLTITESGPSVINNVCGTTKCVVVVISSLPLVIEPYMAQRDALVAAWLPGTEGHGVADVLFGDYGFSGKLSRTWFKSVDQLPMNSGDAHYDPLFPYGFGLTTQGAKSS